MAKTVVQYLYNSGTWIAPPGTTSVQAEAWGSGANGGTRTTSGPSGGGGGGAYAKTNAITVTPGSSYTFQAGGGDSWFSTTGSAPASTATGVLAKAGSTPANNVTTGASGGQAASSVGDVTFSGGSGGTGSAQGGGGGNSGSPSGTGNNGGDGTQGAAQLDSGQGGFGTFTNGDGNPAPTPVDSNTFYVSGTPNGVGGGGQGAKRTNGTRFGGAGSKGMIRLTYTVADTPYVTSVSDVYVNAGSSAGLPRPADVVAGDILLIMSSLFPGSLNLPSGFTNIASFGTGGRACYAVATGSETWPLAISGGGSDYGSAQLFVIRGADTANPVAASATDGNTGTAVTFGAVTPTRAGSLIVQWVGTYTSTTSSGTSFSTFAISTSSPTFVQATNNYNPAGVSAASGAWGYRTATTSTGGGTATQNTSQPWISIAMAISPPALGGGGFFRIKNR